MTYDENGNVVSGLGAYGDAPTIGTSAAEIVGAIPRPQINWEFTHFVFPWTIARDVRFQPGPMVQEAQTLSPYIIALGPDNQPEVSALDVLGQGLEDMGGAVERARDDIVSGAAAIGGGVQNVVKWAAIGLIAYAVIEGTKRGRA